jgi:predicted transcriptional regulator
VRTTSPDSIKKELRENMRTSPPSLFDRLISYNIAMWREEKGLSLRQVADNLQPPVSTSNVHAWEKYQCRVPLEYLLQVATILDCTILDLMDLGTFKMPDGALCKQLQQLTKIRNYYRGHPGHSGKD